MLLFKKPIAEKSKGKLMLMGIEKPFNIWQPRSGLEFRSNHAQKIWLDFVLLVDQVCKTIMLQIQICYMFACFV
jgi:hypothetical protein